MTFLYNWFERKAPLFDNDWFLENEKRQKRAAFFFFYTSNFTKFFLFRRLGIFIIAFLGSICFYFSTSYFRALVAIFADFGLSQGVTFMIFKLPFFLLFLILFNIILLEIAYINTFLVLCPSVNKQIRKLFGEYIIKERCYNSSFLSAKAASSASRFMAVGIVSGVAGGAVTNMFGEWMYSKNYGSYTDFLAKHPELAGSIQPPKKGMGLITFGR